MKMKGRKIVVAEVYYTRNRSSFLKTEKENSRKGIREKMEKIGGNGKERKWRKKDRKKKG